MGRIGLAVVVALCHSGAVRRPFAVPFATADVFLIPRSRPLKLRKGGVES